MSDGQKPKGRARGRAWGRARGAPVASQQAQQQPASTQQPQSPPPQYQQPQSPPLQYQQPGPSPQSQQQPRPSGRARGHVPKQMQAGASGTQQPRQEQDRQQQQQQQQQEEGAYGVDPKVQAVAGAFRGLSVGEARPGQALRRGAMRGRLEVTTPPLITKPETLTSKIGDMGQKNMQLVTNYFRLTKSTNWSLYQYRVDFSPEEERTKVRKALLSHHKDTLGDAYLFDGSMLFVIQKLHPDINTELELFSARDIDKEVIRITIRFTNELAIGDYQYIQLFNIILRSCLDNLNYQLVGREYFAPGNSLKMPEFKIEIWPGYSTSILQFEHNIMMGIDVSHKVLRTDNVWEFLKSCKERYGAEWQRYFVDNLLGSVVFTFYNNRPYRVDDIAFDKTPKDTFPRGNTEISYVDYYHSKYQLTITDFRQPLLISRPRARDIRGGRNQNVVLIPQLCQMTGLSDEMRNNFTLMKAVADKTRVAPNDRVLSYISFMKNLHENENAVRKLQVWNVQFSRQLEPVPCRVFPGEVMYMANKFELKPQEGDWAKCLRNCGMLASVRLEKWILIATKHSLRANPNVKGSSVDNFLGELNKAAHGLRFEMRRPEVVIIDNDKITNYMNVIDRAINSGGLQLVMCVIAANRSDLYSAIKKKCVCDRPMPSQVLASKTLGHRALLSVCTKIVIQMNCKLGGSPWFTPVPFRDTFTMTDGTLRENAIHATMIVGFDVCHDTRQKGKSVGALVASLDFNFTRFYSAVSRHGLGEELSNDIATHVAHAAIRFEEINKHPPPKIIIFRDGVGESNIQYVLAHEIETIRVRLTQMFPQCIPKLSVVVVSKRIQTRFFLKAGSQYKNPLPGTVVDDVVTQPEKYDFFLVSQSVRQGTVTPTNYNVIFDQNKLNPNHIQRLAYKMCHLYYNCTSTVRVPCQVQYAHKLAFLVGQVIHIPPSQELDHLLYYL